MHTTTFFLAISLKKNRERPGPLKNIYNLWYYSFVVAQTPHITLRLTQHYCCAKWLKIWPCIMLKQDRYYKMMAGITCFCCPNKVVFSIMTESQPPHAVFCVLVVSIYRCCEYGQLGGGKLRCQTYLRMAVVLCSFKFVIQGKKLLRNNCCFWLGLYEYKTGKQHCRQHGETTFGG